MSNILGNPVSFADRGRTYVLDRAAKMALKEGDSQTARGLREFKKELSGLARRDEWIAATELGLSPDQLRQLSTAITKNQTRDAVSNAAKLFGQMAAYSAIYPAVTGAMQLGGVYSRLPGTPLQRFGRMARSIPQGARWLGRNREQIRQGFTEAGPLLGIIVGIPMAMLLGIGVVDSVLVHRSRKSLTQALNAAADQATTSAVLPASTATV